MKTPRIEVRVPGTRYRSSVDEKILWDKLGVLIEVARTHMPEDAVLSILLSRACRELRRHNGVETTKEVLAGLIATQDEAAEHDRIHGA